MFGSDISDKLLNKNRLANSCTAEKTNLTAFCIRSYEVDDFDSRFKDFNDRALLLKSRSFAVYLPSFSSFDLTFFVDRLADNVEHTSKSLFSDRNLNTASGYRNLHILAESLTGCEHDTAYSAVAHMLSDLHITLFAVKFNGEGVFYHRKVSGTEYNVYNRSDDLSYSAFFHL